jgi:hypothetical protein
MRQMRRRLDRIAAKLARKEGGTPKIFEKQFRRIAANELSPFEREFIADFQGDQQKSLALAYAEGLPLFAEDWGFPLPTIEEMRHDRRVGKHLERLGSVFQLDYPRECLAKAEEAAIQEEQKEAKAADGKPPAPPR